MTTPTIDVPYPFQLRYDGKEDTDSVDARLSRCYELAANAQLNFAVLYWKTTLVHGVIGPQRIPHAWIEFRSDHKRMVWDPVLDEVMMGTYARDIMNYREWTRYQPREAASLHIREGHFGPWGRDDLRYDIEKIRIDAAQAELCSEDCTEFNHVTGCLWKDTTVPEGLR